MRSTRLCLLVSTVFVAGSCDSTTRLEPVTPIKRPRAAWTSWYRETLAADEAYVSIDAHVEPLVDVRIANAQGRVRHRLIDLRIGRAIAERSIIDPRCVDPNGARVETVDVDHLVVVRGGARHELTKGVPAGYEACFDSKGTRVAFYGYTPSRHLYDLYVAPADTLDAVVVPGTSGIDRRPRFSGDGAVLYLQRHDRMRHPVYTEQLGAEHVCLTKVATATLAATDLFCIEDNDQVATFFDATVTSAVVAAYDGDHPAAGCTLRWVRLADGRELARRTVASCSYAGDSPGFVTATGVVVIGNDVIDMRSDRIRTLGAGDSGTYYEPSEDRLGDGKLVILRSRRGTDLDAGWFEVATVDLRLFLDEMTRPGQRAIAPQIDLMPANVLR